MNAPFPVDESPVVPFTSDDYFRMVATGGFGDWHVELAKGEIVRMAPAQKPHGAAVIHVGAALLGVYPSDRFAVYCDVTARLSDETVRTPDLAVTRAGGDPRIIAAGELILVVEVSDSTLPYDLRVKVSDYAAAGIPAYWVVDLVDRLVHVFEDPAGTDYRRRSAIPFGAALQPPMADGPVFIVG